MGHGIMATTCNCLFLRVMCLFFGLDLTYLFVLFQACFCSFQLSLKNMLVVYMAKTICSLQYELWHRDIALVERDFNQNLEIEHIGPWNALEKGGSMQFLYRKKYIWRYDSYEYDTMRAVSPVRSVFGPGPGPGSKARRYQQVSSLPIHNFRV